MHIGELQTFPSGFTKREFVIDDGADKYPQQIKLEAYKDKAEDVGKLSRGDVVEVFFNLRGNEYNGRYYTNIQAWRIEKKGETALPEKVETDQKKVDQKWEKDDADEIPF